MQLKFSSSQNRQKKIVTRNKTRIANISVCTSTVKWQVLCISAAWHCVLSGFYQLSCAGHIRAQGAGSRCCAPAATLVPAGRRGFVSTVLSIECKAEK